MSRSSSSSSLNSWPQSPASTSASSLSDQSTHSLRPSKHDLFRTEFRTLEAHVSRFQAKTGANRSNVLRLTLLPFLRQNIGSLADNGPQDPHLDQHLARRTNVLRKWWLSILSALRDRQHPIPGADRSAYLEAVAGLMARQEWTAFAQVPAGRQPLYVYESLLYDTIKYVIDKLSLKTVPLPVAAFAGQVFAYGFFYAPGMAASLLHMLRVSRQDIARIVRVSFKKNVAGACSMDQARSLITPCLPSHLHPLVGITTSTYGSAPPPCDQVPGMYGPWSRRWATASSDVFFAFVKHYYAILASLISPDLPWNAHAAAPGLIIVHTFLLRSFDYIVHMHSIRHPSPGGPMRRRVDQLKSLAVIREILHNDNACAPLYEPFCRQLELVLRAVALRTQVHDLEACVVLTDLAEEFLASLLAGRGRRRLQPDNAIGWVFWLQVAERMLGSDHTHTQLRAFALLFNVWDNLPLCEGDCLQDGLDSPKQTSLDWYLSQGQDGLRWAVAQWLVSEPMWQRFFCHWQPLVRAYYHRLVCWKLSSVGAHHPSLLSSVLYANYMVDARELVRLRLDHTHACLARLFAQALQTHGPLPALEPMAPALHRTLAIVANPASPSNAQILVPYAMSNGVIGQAGAASVGPRPRRVDAYDVFDEIAYSYPTSLSEQSSVETLRGPPSQPESPPRVAHRSFSTTSIVKKLFNEPAMPRVVSESRLGRFFRRPESRPVGRQPALKRYSSLLSINFGPEAKTGPEAGKSAPEAMDTDESSESESVPSLSFPGSGTLSTGSTPPSSLSSPGTPLPPSKRAILDSETSSLTMKLIPPPPKLLRATPEVPRRSLRFSLEPVPPQSPRLSMSIEERLAGDKLSSLDCRPRLPFGARSRTPSEAISATAADDVRYWKYSGRALAEWDRVVAEFEHHVQREGPVRAEDIEAPFMIAEIPAKLVAA